MPNYATHALLGTGVGAVYSCVIQDNRQVQAGTSQRETNPFHVGMCAFAGFLGSCVPDKLEPADRAIGPNHRGSCHSLWALGLAIKGAYYFSQQQTKTELERWVADFLGAFCAGIASHLAADMTTARGLNFAAKGF